MRRKVVGLILVALLVPLLGSLPARAVLPAATPDQRASLAAQARTLTSGKILVEATTDAGKVLLVWRTAAGTSRAAVMIVRGGKAAGLIPKGSTRITAQARPTAPLRASATVKVRLDGKPAPAAVKPKPAAAKPTPAKRTAAPQGATAVPKSSGKGKRIVWSKSRNRVWVMTDHRTVGRTFPVTDRDDLTPNGTHRVTGRRNPSYSTDEFGRSWRLDHFVRFYKRCAACHWIGFHAIPVSGTGQLIQPIKDLGTNRSTSHGCLRLLATDAKYLHDFAVPGTKVVVVS